MDSELHSIVKQGRKLEIYSYQYMHYCSYESGCTYKSNCDFFPTTAKGGMVSL